MSTNSISQASKKFISGLPIIAGGVEAAEKEFPHMVIIGYTKEDDQNPESDEFDYNCGGSLVSELFVLSAAHCQGGEINEIPRIAMFGVLKLSDTSHKQTRKISDIIHNRDNAYDRNKRLHDIILFKLNSSVIFNEYIIPICLPSVNQEIGSEFLASGWGQTKYSGLKNDHLLKVLLITTDQSECSAKHKNFNMQLQICAGSKSEFKDTCSGDSGN